MADVDYAIHAMEMPEVTRTRVTQLDENVARVKAQEKAHNRPMLIANYANGQTASSAAAQLKKKHEDCAFYTRKFEDGEGNPRTGVWMQYPKPNGDK